VKKTDLEKRCGSPKTQGIAGRYRSLTADSENSLDQLLLKDNLLLLILDGIQDPHNLGACLRSADAAGVDAVIAPKDRATGLTPTVRKVACGAAESVPFIQVTNLARTLKQLKDAEVWIIGAAGEADTVIYDANLTGKLAIVMGAEEKGLRRLTRENCDLLVKLPMAGQVESLNVSVATGVCLFEAVRQRQ
ncbi:MAG: 23S rRNA (guanosine(2251)-2'-O)-methyltransferase RlmB, partial [Gammaproteobacteria bacterium]|nr:23S rRNA (guanosine(2251)-2'-O)-methyltransferase RlmB [Gammaproteobacteria bacterium]